MVWYYCVEGICLWRQRSELQLGPGYQCCQPLRVCGSASQGPSAGHQQDSDGGRGCEYHHHTWIVLVWWHKGVTWSPSVSSNKYSSVKAQWVYFNIGYFKNRLYIVVCKAHTGLGRTNNPLQPIGYYMYRQFNIQQFYILPTWCIYVFCIDLGTNSDYFPIQH